jgi:hypothetical protein
LMPHSLKKDKTKRGWCVFFTAEGPRPVDPFAPFSRTHKGEKSPGRCLAKKIRELREKGWALYTSSQEDHTRQEHCYHRKQRDHCSSPKKIISDKSTAAAAKVERVA